MSKFDRYFFNQLVVSFLFFSIVLIAVFWVNKAVILFDKLISEGHSAAIFFEFSLLALPEAAALVFPISSFAAAVYVSNRLSNESEFVILRASGVSAGRLSRPVLYFGVIIALVMIVITNVAIPLSKNQLN
ncbi:MAG: LptF/LptG family permease, partial [Paracoccaceae bacterium]